MTAPVAGHEGACVAIAPAPRPLVRSLGPATIGHVERALSRVTIRRVVRALGWATIGRVELVLARAAKGCAW